MNVEHPEHNHLVGIPQAERMRDLVESISAYIEQYHGGSVEMVEFDGEVLKVRLGGACQGCPLSATTLQGWVRGTVQTFFPDVLVQEEIE